MLETLLSDEELTADALEELSDMYESLHAMPLNINTATRDELSVLPFLTDRHPRAASAFLRSLSSSSFSGSQLPLRSFDVHNRCSERQLKDMDYGC